MFRQGRNIFSFKYYRCEKFNQAQLFSSVFLKELVLSAKSKKNRFRKIKNAGC